MSVKTTRILLIVWIAMSIITWIDDGALSLKMRMLAFATALISINIAVYILVKLRNRRNKQVVCRDSPRSRRK